MLWKSGGMQGIFFYRSTKFSIYPCSTLRRYLGSITFLRSLCNIKVERIRLNVVVWLVRLKTSQINWHQVSFACFYIIPFFPYEVSWFFYSSMRIFVMASDFFFWNKVFEDVHNCVVKNWHLFICVKIRESFLPTKIFYSTFNKISISMLVVPNSLPYGGG